MNVLKNIKPGDNPPSNMNAIIEIPRGSHAKYEIDKETGLLALDRILHVQMMYPANYGFIPQTHCDDNDPLDILVLCQENITPFCLVKSRAIGVLKLIDSGEVDDKIIAVAIGDPYYQSYQDIHSLSNNFLAQIKHFFEEYKRLEKNKKVEVKEFLPRKEAEDVIMQSIEDYKRLFG